MKKLFLAMIVCAGFCACSNDDVVVTTTPSDYSREAAAYLTVNIKDVNSGTRATGGDFAYGTATEQVVNNAYFYFYDDNGNYMANGAVTGGVSGTAKGDAGDTGTTQGTNVEWNSGTLVAVYGLDADEKLPTQMLTVLNKPTSVNLERQSLTDALATLAGTPYGNSDGTFVMSTSVYSATTGDVYTTALADTDFALEPINLETDYADGGVNVYVERLAAKVGVDCNITQTSPYTNAGYIYPASETVLANFPMGAPESEYVSNVGGISIQLLGWDVDCVARDAYLVKNIDASSSWGNFKGFVWNGAGDYRCYWAESPNYGVEHTYPTSSNGNTDSNEATAGTYLDEYLRYVSLANPVDMGSTTYCGENTNTSEVLVDSDNSGITNVIVKAQFGDYSGNTGFKGIDLVEFHGEYYTADQFRDKCVSDVVAYDFTVVVDEVIAGLEASNNTLAPYLEDLGNAIIKDYVYVSDAVTDHKVTTGTTGTWTAEIQATLAPFDGSMLSLYKLTDGYVDLFFNGAEQYYGAAGDGSDGSQVEPDLCAKYPAEDIVYGGADLSKYEFYFHVDYSALDPTTQFGASILGLLVSATIDDETEYFLPIDNRYSFTSAEFNDPNFTGNHTYTLRNYLLRAITVEADGIDTQFGKHYPNFYANGMMYYHVPIEHLATIDDTFSEAQYGVVRNHWYNITITSLEGLGRGIADEDEVIVPLPEVDYYYLGADINILSWKMVNQSVGF